MKKLFLVSKKNNIIIGPKLELEQLTTLDLL